MKTLLLSVLALATPVCMAQLQYVPLSSPCRAVDTRLTNSPVQGGTTQVFNPGAACNIPSQGSQPIAYATNVTVVPSGPLGYVTIWGTGLPQPTASTLNSYDGRVKANYAVVLGNMGGQVSVFASNTTHVILDISGYFIEAPATGTAMLFTPVTPCRLLDTRNTTGNLGGPTLVANQVRSFALTGACNLPDLSNGGVLSVNITAIPRGQPLGYLTVWGTVPGTNTPPAPSTLNSNTETVVANAAFLTINAGTNTSISAIGNGNADLIVDVNGYFSNTTTGMAYYPTATPERLLDTRLLSGAFTGEKTISVTQGPSVYVFNTTVVPNNSLGVLTLWPDGTAMPLVSTLNALDGVVTSNMAVVITGTNGAFDAFANGSTNLIIDWEGTFMTRPTADPVVFIGDDISAGLVAASNDPTWNCYNCMATTTSQVALNEVASVIAMHPNAVHILVGAYELSGTCGNEPCDTGAIPLGNIITMVKAFQDAKIPVVVGNQPPCTGIDSDRLNTALSFNFGSSDTPNPGVPLIHYYDIGQPAQVCATPILPNAAGYKLMIPLAQQAIAQAEE